MMREFGQEGPAHNLCRLEWGRRGARRAAARGDVVVIVDVLSFSTAAVVAAERGASLYPCRDPAEAQECARRFGAEVAVRREEVPAHGRFSLSPASLLQARPEDRIALPSPNGATCCHLASGAAAILIGTLRNASAAARAASLLMQTHNRLHALRAPSSMEMLPSPFRRGEYPLGAARSPLSHAVGEGRGDEGDFQDSGLTILACGERWQDDSEEGDLRFALEDYLGAGAILSSLGMPASPDAEVCRLAFDSARSNLHAYLSDCPSGVELRERGWAVDVDLAAQLDASDTVPIFVDGRLDPQKF